MRFALNALAGSIAEHLLPFFPGVAFYRDPNQQGTKPPCMFIQQRFSSIADEIGGRYLRKIGGDLIYLLDYNLPNLQTLYQEAADILDERFDTFQYKNGADTTVLRALDREWTITEDELHYKFVLNVWCEIETLFNPMEVMDYEQAIKER